MIWWAKQFVGHVLVIGLLVECLFYCIRFGELLGWTVLLLGPICYTVGLNLYSSGLKTLWALRSTKQIMFQINIRR